MLPVLVGFAAKALLPSTKKVDKDKLLNRKSSAIERTKDESKEKNIPIVKRTTILTDKLLKPSETDSGGKLALSDTKDKGPTKKSKNIIDSILVTLVNIQNLLRKKNKVDKKQEEEKIKIRKKKGAEKVEETMEGRKGFSFAMPKIKVPNVPFIDQIMNFFGSILIGSLVLFIYKNIEEIIKFFQETFLKIQEFFKLIEPIIKPIWDGLKWIVGGGANVIAKILGIPSQEADTNGIKKNLEEITKKIPVIGDLFKGIQNTVDSIRGYKEPTDTGAGVGGVSSAPGDEKLAAFVASMEASSPENAADAMQVMLNRAASGYSKQGLAGVISGREQFSPISAAIYGTSADPAAAAKYGPIAATLPGRTPQEKFKYLQQVASEPDGLNKLQKIFGGGSAGVAAKILNNPKYLEASRRNVRGALNFGAGSIAQPGDVRIRPGGNYFYNFTGKVGVLGSQSTATTTISSQKQQKADAVAQQAAQQAQIPTPQVSSTKTTPQASSTKTTPPTPQVSSTKTTPQASLTKTKPQVAPTQAQVSIPQVAPTQAQVSIPQVAPTQAQVSIPQAQVSPVQPVSPVVESVPQITQQADYEIPAKSSMILPIPVGGNANPSGGSLGGGGVIPVGLSKREALNSYYQSQLIGFLYKQG